MLNYKKPTFWMSIAAVIALIVTAVCLLTNPMSGKLRNIEFRSFKGYENKTNISLWNGKVFFPVKDVKKETLEDLLELKISKSPISENRNSNRSKDHCVVFVNDTQPSSHSSVPGVYICFNKDFTQVWVDDDVKPTLSFKVLAPSKAKDIYRMLLQNSSYLDGNGVEEPQNVTVRPGSVDVPDFFDIKVSWANWSERGSILAGCLNADKMAISSTRHLPLQKFHSLADLNAFKTVFAEEYTMNQGYDEIKSFEENTASYDTAFFKVNDLFLVYVDANSGSLRFGVDSIFNDGTSLCIYVKQTNHPETGTCDMAGWFITVAIPKTATKSCTEFDAVMNN